MPKVKSRERKQEEPTATERGLYTLSDSEFEAWLAAMAQYADKIPRADDNTFSRRIIYQDHD